MGEAAEKGKIKSNNAGRWRGVFHKDRCLTSAQCWQARVESRPSSRFVFSQRCEEAKKAE